MQLAGVIVKSDGTVTKVFLVEHLQIGELNETLSFCMMMRNEWRRTFNSCAARFFVVNIRLKSYKKESVLKWNKIFKKNTAC